METTILMTATGFSTTTKEYTRHMALLLLLKRTSTLLRRVSIPGKRKQLRLHRPNNQFKYQLKQSISMWQKTSCNPHKCSNNKKTSYLQQKKCHSRRFSHQLQLLGKLIRRSQRKLRDTLLSNFPLDLSQVLRNQSRIRSRWLPQSLIQLLSKVKLQYRKSQKST